jgi:3'-phosphoadenosine 5'-phosphosulfate sulfotransferase (PAPS reductase)/FAD synthetase
MKRFNTPLTNEAAKSLLALDLEDKVITSYEKLDEWYTAWGGQCYVSFSGGKDSTVLAYLAARYLSSFRCCGIMKKSPSKSYEHRADVKPTTATMAEESLLRMQKWRETGCNAFEGKRPLSKPMSFWTEQDVLRFIVDHQLPYASVYGDIVASDGENDYGATLIDCKLRCTGCQRTGCMFCAFGAHLEKGENRFERMKHTHPKHYDFCIGGGEWDADGLWKPNEKGLGYARVLDYIGVRY